MAEDETPAGQLQRFEDSMDEMSAAVSLFRNRRDLEKRKGISEGESFERVLDEETEAKVPELVRVIKNDSRISIALLLQQFRSIFPDESDLVLVLREMLYKKDLDEIQKQRLTGLLIQIEKSADPKRLKAGINVALKARLFARTLEFSPALLRESYREFIASEEPEVVVYQHWIEQFGAKKRQQVIGFIEDALVADMESLDPSCTLIEFGQFLHRFSQIKNIRAADIIFTERLSLHPLFKEKGIDQKDLLVFMFSMMRNCWHIENYINDIFLVKFSGQSASHYASFLQILHNGWRKLPVVLFQHESDREVADDEFKRLAENARKNELHEIIRN